MKKILTINDMKVLAKKRVPKMFYDYVDSGSWTQSTYIANEKDFNDIYLKQKVGVNISNRSLKSKILSTSYAMPIGLSPVGFGGMLHKDGEILVAQVCEKVNIPYILSTMSICSMEEVASNSSKPFWFQLYVMKDKEFVENAIKRAKNLKCSALVVTMDLSLVGQRHADIRNDLSAPPRLTLKSLYHMLIRPYWCLGMLQTKNRTFGNIIGHAKGVNDLHTLMSWVSSQFDQKLSWDYIKWIKKIWGGPIILKGIMDVEDAKTARNLGVDAIVVSNHGGRQLDGTISSIKALESIVDAVGKDIEVYFDGGIRSGQSVIKALSIGANATFMGRSYLYGLAALGKEGVELAIDIIKKEMDLTMALCGINDINKLQRSNIY